ncbi:efflux RND transporter periplasmic adaptor subunit [Tahibacter amnicola]|uniref:Efflux RND transporter periplasmic adaptor subunit n=1 Tax=Tahibacter amnicola TaxID=2976241 RepID=A0ABY6BFG7_9GAMM|nr:efflux RND transporter periplasmic adaptor subunit [Tahibacter amnicola]UXI68565.1 efflux RND transporter periplasmic adaptor subunit [Tahibacter amnicola]
MQRTNPTTVALRVRTAVLAAALALILAGCAKTSGAPAHMPPPPAVNVAGVVEKSITLWDEFTGRIEAVDKVEVRPRVTGYLEKIQFEEGREVKKGDVLFIIDDREYRAAFARAQADVERAQSRVTLAQRQLERARQLAAAKLGAAIDVDTREDELAQARADVKAMQAAADQARLNLDFTRVTAPIDGRVGKAQVTPGNLVTSGMPTATLLTTVVSLDPVYVSFEGDEQTYLRYQGLARSGERQSSREVRNPVRMGLADEDGFPHEGVMNFVDNELDANTGTIRARAVFDNKERLFTPGLFARIKLLGSGTQKATLIHDRAILTDQDRKFVWVLGPENKALRRDIKIGPQVDGLRVVTDGLTANDSVIVNGVQKVFFPGAPVAPNVVPMDQPELPPPAAAGAGQGVAAH